MTLYTDARKVPQGRLHQGETSGLPSTTAIVSVAAGLLLTCAGALWAFQNFGIYRFSQSVAQPQSLAMGDVRILSYKGADGLPLAAWFIPPRNGKPLIVSFFGNFSDVGSSFARMRALTDQGFGVAMPVYRGSSGMAGRPSEEVLLNDGRLLYDQLEVLTGMKLPADQRVIHGFSLGSGLATRLASERPARALILESGYDSLCRYFQRRSRMIPLCALMWRERYDAIRSIGRVRMPLLMAHGAQDDAILPAWGMRLFDAANHPKAWRLYPQGHHGDLFKNGLAADISEFLLDPHEFAAAKPRHEPGSGPATSD